MKTSLFRRFSTKEESDENNSLISKRRQKKVFIDLLLDLYEKGEIDKEGIKEDVDTFMSAGHETTARATGWTQYEIGRHPEIQNQL